MAAIEYHRTMLADTARNDTLIAALKKTVRHGDTVIDVGSGTGLLAMAARGFGAGHCILIERDPDIAALSRKLLTENGVKSCTVMEGDSRNMRGLPKADVVISETLGNFAYEENIIEILEDAKRFLKPSGHLLPHSLKNFVAPVTSPRYFEELSVWRHVGHDLTFKSAEEISINNMYVRDLTPSDLLAGEENIQCWDTIDFTKKNKSVRTGSASWTVEGDGTVYGLGLFWECTLTKGTVLSTSPGSHPTHWRQIYLPLRSPVHLLTGDTLQVSLTSDSRPEVKINVAWEVTHLHANGKRETQSMDMRKGY